MLLRFQWQIEKVSPELGLRPGFDSVSPHNISKSNVPNKFSKKTDEKINKCKIRVK